MKTSEKNLRERKSKKLDSKAKGTLELLLIAGIILIIPLFFVVRSQASPQSLDVTPTAMMEWATTTPAGAGGGLEITPSAPQLTKEPLTAQGVQPPACTFPLAQTTMEESTSEEYTFSEPQVVLTAPANVGIVEWLPDSERVLITRDIPAKDQQSIELFNPQTGETQVYALRKRTPIQGSPIWVESLKAIVYPETFPLSLSYDSNGGLQYPISMKRLLWLSQGDPASAQPLEDSKVTVYIDRHPTVGSNFTVIAKPDGSQMIYSDGVSKQLSQRKTLSGVLGTVQPLSFDLTQWDYRRPSNVLQPVSFKMAWQPGTTQVFLYSGPNSGEYTFLLDIENGQICELNLFGKENPNNWQQSWAITAHWSLDGRYLAVVQTKAKEFDFSDLIILDTTSGKLYQIDAKKLSPSESDVQGKYFVVDVAWAPDNRHLAAIGQVDYYSPDGSSLQVINRVYLIDFISNQVIQVSPQEINSNIGETSLLWSKDGAQLLVKCPTHEEGRLCLISVHKSTQH